MRLILYCTAFISFLILLNNYVCWSSETNGVVSVTRSLVWGPGLDVDIVLPVRYFFIQPVDTKGHKYVLFRVIALKGILQ